MHLWKICPAKSGSLGAVHLVKYGSLDRQDPFLSGAGIADSLSAAPPILITCSNL